VQLQRSGSTVERPGENSTPTQLNHEFINTYWGRICIVWGAHLAHLQKTPLISPPNRSNTWRRVNEYHYHHNHNYMIRYS
jgi:hypothetical protein